MKTLMAEGFILGLSTGTFCLMSCAPLLVPYILADGRCRWGPNLWLVVEFMTGRLVAYLTVGLLVGWAGRQWAERLPPLMVPMAMVASGVLILGYVFSHQWRGLGLCRYLPEKLFSKPMPFLLGVVVGINVCPPFLAGMLRVFEMGNPIGGAGYFLSFYFGSSLYLLIPLIAVAPFARVKRLQFIGALSCVLAGIWFLGQGILSLLHSPSS